MDVIVVEASGIAEPRDLIRLMIASENPDIRYGGLAEVVDAAEFEAARERHPELADHLRLADLVVLNKADRVDADALAKVTATVEELAPGRPVLVTAHGRVDPRLFFDPEPRGERVASCPSTTCAKTTTTIPGTCTPSTRRSPSPPRHHWRRERSSSSSSGARPASTA